jgi:arylsulfatase
LAVLVASLVAGVGSSNPVPQQGAARVDDVGVVLVILDAAGAPYLGAYGNHLPTSPNIDKLARTAGGTVFERAYAQSAWTLPSMASLFTGRYPPRRAQTRTVVAGDTLATLLHEVGLQTAAFSESPYVTAERGFARGFDVFHEYFPKRLFDHDDRFYRADNARATEDAIAWVEAYRHGRFFLYLHLLAPHSPYLPPPPFKGRFDPSYTGTFEGVTDTLLRINDGTLHPSDRDLEHLRLAYEENLAYGDHLVGRLFDTLRRTRVLDRSIVIVAADHGEGFREHGWMLHTTTLFEEMIHVPLVIRFPPRFGRLPNRWDGIVELRDIVPTVCDALRLSCDSADPSRSLLRRLRTPDTGEGVARAWTNDGVRALGALVTGRYKLVMDMAEHRLALYALADDPREVHDLAGTERPLAIRLARRLRGARGEGALSSGKYSVSPAAARALRALGYTE